MAAPRPLSRPSTVDLLAAELRREILEGSLEAGARLRERELCEGYEVARHTLRAALRALANEGLVEIEPHRGARVVSLEPEAVNALYELRAALELEAAHLALERHDGRLPEPVHAALSALTAACEREAPWSEINGAHATLHAEIVAASRSPRIVAAHATLNAELLLFLVQLRPHLPLGELAEDHIALVEGLERDGTEVLRDHLRRSAETLAAAR
jgi:DNA-binding GntR family transcriptional regulator